MGHWRDLFLEMFYHDPVGYAAALNLAVVSNIVPPHVNRQVTVFMPWAGQQQPVSVVDAFMKLAHVAHPDHIIFTGGRTHSDWPEDMNEADLLHDLVSQHFNIASKVHKERDSTNTFEQFLRMGQLFPDLIRQSGTLVILAHNIHTRRCLMTARKTFCDLEKIITTAEFDRKTYIVGYDAEKPMLDPLNHVNLAETLARLVSYTQKGHLSGSIAEQEDLREICTRAQRYALTAKHDRRIA